MTLDEIKKNTTDEILVLVDTDASKENVSRAAQSRGWQVARITEEDDAYRLELKKG
jgi:TusA-related sulfurtransferase